MKSLADHDVASLRAQLVRWGHPPSLATRILREFYAKDGLPQFDRNVGTHLIARLALELTPLQSKVVREHKSVDGTVKMLLGLDAGGAVEAVLMPSAREGIAAG